MNARRPNAPNLVEQTRESLAFPEVLRFFASQTQTQEGARLLNSLNLMPVSAQGPHFRELDQWRRYLADHPPIRFPEIPSPELFQRNPDLEPFDGGELRAIRDFLMFRRQLMAREHLTFVQEQLRTDADIDALTQRLDRLFEPNGAWREDISPVYQRLIRDLTRTEESLDQMLQSLVKRYADMLSETLVFERNYRKVLGVKQNFRGRVRGILQDYSASGATVYIEPEQTVEAQNRLRQTKAEIEEELWRIRVDATKEVLREETLLQEVWPVLTRMDMMQALSLSARKTQCQNVCPNPNHHLTLKRARHPFLDAAFTDMRQKVFELDEPDGRHMVPFELSLNDDLRGLIISGANTGGKTVTLKTTGLIAWMANSGLPVPVDEGSMVPFYDHIVADIGDHQSLNYDLSTYASHLANMKAVFEIDSPHTLVLLDEMGSGTDPQEGNALAQAMIEDMSERRFHTLITTHQQILCTLALNHPHLDNGSMVFDPKRLRPTFNFQQGVPGRSHALDTAANAGLPESLLTRSHELIDDDQVDIQAAIRKLQEQHKQLAKRQKKLRREELRLHRRTQDARKQGEDYQQLQEELRERTRVKVAKAVEKAERELRTMLQEIDSQKQRRSAVAKFATVKKEVIDRHGAPEKLDDIQIETSEKPREEWRVGDRVFLRSFMKEGELLAVDHKKARVDCRGMTLTVPIQDLLHLKPEKNKPEPKVIDYLETERDDTLSMELRLLGKHVEDALLELEETIDRALRKDIPYLKIIHGHGSGALKTAVRDALKRHDARQSFTIEINEKNDGVTELKFE